MLSPNRLPWHIASANTAMLAYPFGKRARTTLRHMKRTLEKQMYHAPTKCVTVHTQMYSSL